MLKKMLVFFASIMLIQFCFAQQLMPVMMVSIKANEGKISISDARVVVDHLSSPEEAGKHAIKLKDSTGRTLYQLKVYMHGIGFPPYGMQMTEEERKAFYESLAKNFEKTVYCNNNGACEESENYLSCASDCPLNEKDNYCLPLKDAICDPDCSKGIDPDCATKKEKEEEGFDIYSFIASNYLFLAIALIITVIVAYRLILLRKKK